MKKLLSILTLCIPAVSLVAGTYTTITLDQDYSDWASVPVLATDSTGDGNPVDFTNLYVANDDNFLYIRFTLDAAAALNGTNNQVYISIDNDNNTATGFDVYGLGLVGSEVAWQNDFPFQQGPGAADFNTGTLEGGGALIAGYNSIVSQQEIGLSRAATFTSGGAPIFPNDTISIIVYSNGTAADDVIGSGTYTFATVPEPSSIILSLSGIAALMGLYRFRRK